MTLLSECILYEKIYLLLTKHKGNIEMKKQTNLKELVSIPALIRMYS